MRLPLTLRPRPSAVLAAALALAHVLAAAALVPTGLSLAFKVPLLLVLTLSLAWCLRRHVWRHPIVAVTLQADGGLEVARRDGSRAAALVHPHTTVFPWLSVLRLRVDGRWLALALLPDALNAEDYRQLRLWLRWKSK